MDKEQALRIWDLRFPGREEAYDYASHPIRREDYQNKESDRGWDLDLVKPLSQGGTLDAKNLLPAAFTTILLRNHKTSFKIGRRIYEVRKGREYKTFALFDVTDHQHPIDLTPSEETQDPEFNRKRMDDSLGKDVPQPPRMDLNAPLRNSLFNRTIERETQEEAPSSSPVASEERKEEVPTLDETKEEPASREEATAEAEIEQSIGQEKTNPSESVDLAEEGIEVEETKDEIADENPISAVKEETSSGEKTEAVLSEEETRNESIASETDRKELESLKEQITLLQAQREEEKQADQERDEKIRALEEEKRRLDDQIQSLEGENKLLQEQRQQLLSEQDSYRRQVQESQKADTEKENALLLAGERERNFQDRANRAEEERKSLQDKVEGLIRENALLNERASLERKETEEKYQRLLQEKDELSTEKERLSREKEELLQRTSLDEEKSEESLRLLTQEKQDLASRNQELQKKTEELIAELSGLKEEFQKLEQEKAQEEDRKIQDEKRREEEKAREEEQKKELEESARKEREEQEAEITSLNEKSLQNEALLVSKDSEIQKLGEENATLREEFERCQEEKEKLQGQKEELEKEKNRLKEIQLVLRLSGKEESYPAIKSELEERGFAYDAENVEAVLSRHPEYLKEETGKVFYSPKASESHEETITKAKVEELGREEVRERILQSQEKGLAEKLFQQQGRGKESFTDFAGRRVDRDFYLDSENPQGWDVFPLEEGNGLVVNLATLKEIKTDHPFVANHHLFELVQKEGKKTLISKETVVNPYDLLGAIEISQENSARKGALIYLYVKAVGTSTSFADRKELSIFFDLLDRTAKRCCPLSYLQMEVENQKFDHAFLTFDGTIEGAYKEIFDYAILVNSYRDAFRKRGKMDAVLVLDELLVTPGQRHDCYERLCVETKDPALNVTRLNLCLSGVVSTPIKRTLHIGPAILDKVPIDKGQLKVSRLGQELTKEGAEGKAYMECNFIYTLDGSAQEKGQNE